MREWTVMIYMAGDNNLSEDMIRSVTELKEKIAAVGDVNFPDGQFGGKNNVNFIVQFDGEHPYVKTKYYDLTYTDQVNYPQNSKPADLGEKPPTASAAQTPVEIIELNLKHFVESVLNDVKLQAKNYALILSGHSDAFLGRTLLLDENPSGVVSLQAISKILSDLKAKFPNDGKLDILAFDSCLMNTIEVNYEFKDVVHTCIGSQGDIPNFTWDYKKIGEKIN